MAILRTEWACAVKESDNPEYVARWHIIEPAFTAHQKGYYASSIRTLAPEVEGIASHVVVRNTLNGIRNKKEGLHLGATESVILRMLTVAGKIPELDKNGDLTHWLRMKSLVRYVEDIFCKRVDFEGQYNRIRSTSELNRHGISHGIQLGAFTHMNSLRLFLLLDAIHLYPSGVYRNGGNGLGLPSKKTAKQSTTEIICR